MSVRKFVLALFACTLTLFAIAVTSARACPFCNAVAQTLRQEMAAMDAVVIATAIDGPAQRNEETGEVKMRVEKVLKGETLVKPGDEVNAIYYGDVQAGRKFMLSGVDPPKMQWSCLPLSERAEQYLIDITELPDDDVARLKFYYKYLQDVETMLSRDAYDEFASAPYLAVKKLAPDIDHKALVSWINDPETTVDRKRLYLTMLGVCGSEKDLPMLEEQLRSTQKSSRSGLDALIACYLTLAGEKGLPLVDELFMKNPKSPYPDTYAAIMAIRFHGTEGEVIARSALVESLHHLLDREELADLVIPDLARWSDWSQIDKMKQLFIDADADNNWVRVPVVNYLRACPLPEAAAALTELEKVDPESVKRANTFFAIPIPAKDTTGKGTSNSRPSKQRVTSTKDTPTNVSIEKKMVESPALVVKRPLDSPTAEKIDVLTASISPASSTRADVRAAANPWRLVYVVTLALSTVMIVQFLLLSGGPLGERS